MKTQTHKEYPYQNLSLQDMESKVWKDIPDYEGAYQVSNMGRVKSLAREIHHRRGIFTLKNDRILKQQIRRNKVKTKRKSARMIYITIVANGKLFPIATSRIVYSRFIKPLNHLPLKTAICHYPINNQVENLYAHTYRDLAFQNIRLGKYKVPKIKELPLEVQKIMFKNMSCPISRYSLEGIYLGTYPSMCEAARKTGIPQKNISAAALGKYHQSGGFLWRKGSPRKKINILPAISHNLDKNISQYDMEGNYLASYKTCAEASRKIGLQITLINSCINFKIHSCGGFLWRKGKDSKKILPPQFKYIKTVSQYDLEGNYIATYSSIKEASEKTGASLTAICTVIKNTGRISGRYFWREGENKEKIKTDLQYNYKPAVKTAQNKQGSKTIENSTLHTKSKTQNYATT